MILSIAAAPCRAGGELEFAQSLRILGPVSFQSSSLLFPPEVWARLSPLDARSKILLRSRGLSDSGVKQASYEVIEELASKAAAQGLSALDLFSDDGLLGTNRCFIPGGVLERINRKFDFQSLFPIQGKTQDGEDFSMLGLLLGDREVHVLYNVHSPHNKFYIDSPHPLYAGYGGPYTFPDTVSVSIAAGASGKSFVVKSELRGPPLGAYILEFQPAGPKKVRATGKLVITSSKELPVYPIIFRP